MRSKSRVPRSTVRQTLYPVIRLRRRRYVSGSTSRQAQTQHSQYVATPVESNK